MPIGGVRAGYLSGVKDAIPDTGVSRWTLDNANTGSGTTDDVWNGYNGTLQNGVTTGATGANVTYSTNEAFSFDDSQSQYVDCGDITEINGASAVTIGAWVNLDTTTENHGIIGKGAGGGSEIINVYFGESGNFGSDSIQYEVRDSDDAYNSISTGFSSTSSWVHVVAVYDNGDMRLYLDGTGPDATGTQGSSLNSTTDQFKIGSKKNTYYMGGRIDDPRIYSKALTDTEVSNWYNNGSI